MKVGDKNILYIDAANLIKSSAEFLDFQYHMYDLLVYLRDKYRITKVIYFTGRVGESESDYNYLVSAGVEIVFKHVYTQNGKTKANCDVEIAHRITADIKDEVTDNLVLLSGDGDFSSLLDYAKENLKRVNVFSVSRKNTSQMLIMKRYLQIVYLEDLKEKFKAGMEKRKGPAGLVVPEGRLFVNEEYSTVEKIVNSESGGRM
jgi:uncharacterized LabA/DUF88 family protein